jgi:vacuolar protein sorting-associated protein 8
LHKVLTGLCNYPGEDIADDAQLSAEYLLSVYHPPDFSSLVPLFRKVRFYRVLKHMYKSERQFNRLLEIYFEDLDDQESIFNCLAECLGARSLLTKRQIKEVHEVIETHANQLININPTRAAETINLYAPPLHQKLLDSIENDPEAQYVYLRTLMESMGKEASASNHESWGDFMERYVRLMCKFDPSHVVDFVELVQTSDLHLDKVLPYMEESGVIDAAVILMYRDGQIRGAMDRLVRHLKALEATLIGLLSGSTEDMESIQVGEAAEDLLAVLQRYTNIGIWLCQGQMNASRSNPSTIRKKGGTKSELLPEEVLWLDLIDATVQITRHLSASWNDFEGLPAGKMQSDKLVAQLRTLVQRTFTALLTSTSTPTPSGASLSFLRILRAFLTIASISSPNLTDLRAVLASIFSAYAYEEIILSLANRLLDKDLFVNVRAAAELRQRGWRPRGSTCEGCGRRVWGPGVTGDVFGEWEKRQELELKRREERMAAQTEGRSGRGKGRAHTRNVSKASIIDTNHKATGNDLVPNAGDGSGAGSQLELGAQKELEPLVVLACRHIYHQSCLEAIQAGKEVPVGISDGREFRCPIDG